ncbi:MAG TPA: hypothetical protein VLW85_14960 [Myxococcales bacterium]|nr:hypothetical protein [Myxococcales bacterium]
MTLHAACLLASLLSSAAVKDFEGLTCGSDLAPVLLGRRMSDGPVVKTEKRYEKLGLKALGSDEAEQGVTFVSWAICGDTYLTLERRSVIVDAVRIEGARDPAWSECKRSGESATAPLLIVADPAAAAFRVARAFKIDYRAGKFVAVDPAGLTCEKP